MALQGVENIRHPLGRPTVPQGFSEATPKMRTLLGDVEIDNPNLLYHLDNGNGKGWIDIDGAYVRDGFLYPGKTRAPGQADYTWWNRGKPFINTRTKRLMTASPNDLSMMRIREQDFPIGQWNGKSGFVQNSEYVSADPVDVYNSTYTWEPEYGYRKVAVEEPTITWEDAATSKPFSFKGFKKSPTQMHLKRAQAKGFDTSGIEVYDVTKDDPETNAFLEKIAKQYGMTVEDTRDELIKHLRTYGHAGNFKDTKYIIHDGTSDNLDARISHEIDHLLHIPERPISEDSYYPRVMKRPDKYFTIRNNTELAARGSQLHDYFGHTGNEPITEGMLEYARQHYIQDTGLNNDMHDFLWAIKDNKKVAKWLTRYASAIAPFGVLSTTGNNQGNK